MNPCATPWQRKWLELDVVHPRIQEMATAAEAFCRNWVSNEKSPGLLVLCGNTGTGKTHTARAISHYCTKASMTAFERGAWGTRSLPSTFYLAWPEAANQFNDKNFSAITDATENDLVTLDDVGAENDPWKICADKLCQILSRRENKFTVLTTNIQVEDWPAVFDVRISDRLWRNSKVVNLAAVPSYVMRSSRTATL